MTSGSNARPFRLVAPSYERDVDGDAILEMTGSGDMVLIIGLTAATALAAYAAVATAARICDMLWTIVG